MIKLNLLVKTCLLLVVLINAETQQQQQQQQPLKVKENRQRLAQTKNFVQPTRKLKFGDKKPKTVVDNNSALAFQENAKYPNKSQSISQQQQPPPQPQQQQQKEQQFAVFEIPIIQKHRPSNSDSYKGQRQRASHLEQSKRKANSPHEKRLDAIATPRNRSRNRAEEKLNATSLRRNTFEKRQINVEQQSRGGGNRDGGSLLAARPHSRKSAITTTTPIPTTKRTTTTTTPRPSWLQQNPFNIFSPQFWSFSNPATTKKPPKKYTPSSAEFNQASNQQKVQKSKILSKTKTTSPPTTTTTSTTTTTTMRTTTTTTTAKNLNVDGPFRIALPTLNFFNSETQKPKNSEKDKEKRAVLANLREKFDCPRESEVRFQLFPKICKIDSDCSVWNRDEICCDIFGSKSCVSGIAKPLKEGLHSPILGLIPRKCPSRPLAELWWEVKECQTDMDCWPRVCCPDGRRRYCRTSQPELQTAPVQVKRSFDYLSEYLECTPPPPQIFDLHPKACTSTFDCFPNVCCQEAGLRHCRPPKKSVLTLMANFLNVDLVKRFAQNIVIK